MALKETIKDDMKAAFKAGALEHGPRFVMDFRRMADREDNKDAVTARHEIPDVAAEAAHGGGANASFTPAEPERRAFQGVKYSQTGI